ncbi:RNA polymerase subunit sigma-70 [Microbacterium sp. EST19A]|uniref:RNA polymerase subunit sigma-70 n=1 Tax=Microbacterium sp. EST19A TaxID=2862681 RepID=UPI001CBE7404|nr:RNA polymerase subunit sigma-70 [Microbacterium sp. EST19A]
MSDLDGAVNLTAAASGDGRAFERVIAPHRRELLVHAYRLLGSSSDAEDALQEALLTAWRALDTLREPGALRPWLYRLTTRVAMRFAERRGPRMLSWDAGEAHDPAAPLGPPSGGPWIEPFRDPDPARAVERREHIELAWMSALQLLPPLQRATVVLKDVLGYSSAETAAALETTTAAVNSALQRARVTLAASSAGNESAPTRATSATAADRDAVRRFSDAFAASDIVTIVELLADDVRFTMPPLPAWFDGRQDVRAFLAERVLATPWRLEPLGDVNGHPALLGHQWQDDAYRPAAVMVIHADDGQITWIATFIEPSLVAEWSGPAR